MDKIFISDLLVRCIIGVNDEERREKQDVIINIEFETDTVKAGQTDNFADTVDYHAISKRILAHVEHSEYFLVEKLAESIASIVLEDSRIKKTKVRVEKPGALRFARSVGVEITRENTKK